MVTGARTYRDKGHLGTALSHGRGHARLQSPYAHGNWIDEMK